MTERLILTAAQLAQIRTAAETAYPEECCGLLVGVSEVEGAVVSEVVAAANVAEDRASRFTIDPQAQFDLMRRLRGRTLQVIGHYHSHPNGASELSAHDRAMAHDPAAVWVVMPVAAQRAGTPRAFRCLAADTVAELAIEAR